MNPPAFIWLIGLLLFAAPVVYFAGRRHELSFTQPLALTTLLAGWVPLIIWVRQAVTNSPMAYSMGTVTLQADGLSLVLAITSLGLGTLVTLYSRSFIKKEPNESHYYALLLLLIAVMIGLGCATDLFNLWVWFEAMTIASYFLIGFHQDRPGVIEATVKYLIQGAVGSVLILVGIAFVLLQTGSLGFTEMGASAPLLQVAGLLFLVGFGIKAAIVPLHTWLPDAHSQAPSGISALLSGIVIEAGLIAMLRTLFPLLVVNESWAVLLALLGALNMLAGNLLALRQTQVKRLLAYSSLSHVGYMLLGFGIAGLAGQPLGAQGAFFHLMNHGLMKGLAFLAAGVLLHVLQTTNTRQHALTLNDLSGAAGRYPVVALTLSLAVLGLGGLPPLAGFMSKWQIFTAGAGTHSAFILGLIVFAALNSVLSLAYYAPLVNTLYHPTPSPAISHGAKLSHAVALPLVVLALSILSLGLWPNALAWLTAYASAAILYP